MSLNRALLTFLRRRGRRVRYRCGDRIAVTNAWITPCADLPETLSADFTGLNAENRYVYLSTATFEAPPLGTLVDCGGEVFRVEQSGSVFTGNAFDYVWALLIKEEAAVWND